MTIREKVSSYLRRQRLLRELNGLDTRQLKDIGISRADIAAIARGEFS